MLRGSYYKLKKNMNRNLKSFNQFYPINENVAPAKALLLKLAADEKKRRLKLEPTERIEFTPEEEKKILNNPDYIEVRDYFLNTVKKPGLVYPFTYFRVVEKLPMTNSDGPDSFSVENLYRKYEEMSPMLSTFPLPFGSIDNYIKRTPEGQKSFEKLWDDLEDIASLKPIKEFVDNFVGPIRREFTESLKLKNTDPERAELLDRLYHAVTDIKKLKPIVDPETNIEETAEEQLIKYGSKYKDTRTYPEFEDTYVAFKDFVRDCEDKVSGWGSGIGEFIELLKSISPSIKILYYNIPKKIVVTSARSAEGMRAVCKVSNAPYCIRTDSTFWSYTSGKLQISINLLDLPKTDNKFLTSLTIDPSGRITSSANRSNSGVSRGNQNYVDFMKEYGIYSPEIEESISKNFESELIIKKIIQSLEQKTGKNNIALIHALGSLGVQRSIEEGEYSKEEMDAFKNIIVSIIKKDNSITYSEIVKAFNSAQNGGFFSLEDVDLFKELSENKYDKNDVINILDLTKDGVEMLGSFLEQTQDSEDPNTIRLVKHLVDIHPSVIEYAERVLL
jgi:hypothetical protein